MKDVMSKESVINQLGGVLGCRRGSGAALVYTLGKFSRIGGLELVQHGAALSDNERGYDGDLETLRELRSLLPVTLLAVLSPNLCFCPPPPLLQFLLFLRRSETGIGYGGACRPWLSRRERLSSSGTSSKSGH
ncbi:hypothetical protein PC121_g22165 [Phytophthora cactorum]|nr:hypothetical protein PC121_g22165 [Phytophthora cactorum]KAG4039315.1 hypothetical protein PC123_g25127 [Phytophthora cactorum]